MKALVFTDTRQVQIQDSPDPIAGANQAVIKVIGTGICGSDLTGFLGHSPRRRPPLILGHEVIGTAVHVPPGEWPFQIGDRVVANPLQACGMCDRCRAGQTNICAKWSLIGMDRTPGAFAEYVTVAARNVYPLTSGVPDAQAVMIEPLANGVHLFNLIRQHSFGCLAIYGAGTQGILMLALARQLGYREIAIVDTNSARLGIGERMGAVKLLNPRECDPAKAIVEWTNGAGVDVGIDAVGTTPVRQSLVNAVRKGGEIMLLGLHDVMSDVDFALVVRNEIRLQGSFAYTAADFETSKKLLEDGSISIEPWTVSRPLEDGQAAFDRLVGDPGDTLKIILTP